MTVELSVKGTKYGAIGDGQSSSDGKKIQRAIIDAVAVANSGQDVRLCIPRGIYRTTISLNLNLPSPGALTIESDFGAIVAHQALLTNNGNLLPLLSITDGKSASSFRLEGLVLNGHGGDEDTCLFRASAGLRAVHLSGRSQTVEQVVAIGGRVGFDLQDCSMAVFRSCRASLCYDAGWRLNLCGPELQLVDCAATANGRGPVNSCSFEDTELPQGHGFLVTSPAGLQLEGAHAENNGGFGLLVSKGPSATVPASRRLSMVGGHFEQNLGGAIGVTQVDDVMVRFTRFGAHPSGKPPILATQCVVKSEAVIVSPTSSPSAWNDGARALDTVWNV